MGTGKSPVLSESKYFSMKTPLTPFLQTPSLPVREPNSKKISSSIDVD
jgi:hypothetical protein